MKKAIFITLLIGILGGFVYSVVYLYGKSKTPPKEYRTQLPSKRDIVRKTIATGALVPRKEIEIKPHIQGVVAKLFVKPGQLIKAGDEVAAIRIIPNAAALASAQANVNSARISSTSAKAEFDRHKRLFDQGIESEDILSRFRLEYQLRRQDYFAAINNLEIVKKGVARGSKTKSNIVTAPSGGMILDVPVREGTSVTEANSFNAGTTLATVADMTDMLFRGKVDETEVGKIKKDMELSIRIGAMPKVRLKGVLERIAPKGVQVEGAIQFEIEAKVEAKDGVFIRANYSANANIVLERVTNVLAISESLLQFDKKQAYVEIETEPKIFERRNIEVGISDGIFIEVKSGIGESDKLKNPQRS